LSSELNDLYQQVIVDHAKRPRNFRVLTEANRKVDGYNPLCGDKVTIYVKVEGGVVRDISFQGSGCAISKASASMMTQSLKGKTRADAEKLFGRFHDMVTGHAPSNLEQLGKLTVFSGVSEFPVRVKCATLAWHTLQAALEGKQDAISTE
jgi:nitrogen fixation protein NifU and related proteins